MKSKAMLFLAAILLLLAGQPTYAQPSVAFQSNPAHDGSVTFPAGLKLPLQQVWSLKFPVTMGTINDVGYPLIVGDKVFVTVTDLQGTVVQGNQVLALSLQDGQQLWRKGFAGTQYWTALAYDNGRLFVMTGEGILFALDPENGKLLWKRSLKKANSWIFTSPPTAQGGRVFVAGSGMGGTLFSVDQATGNIIWSKPVATGSGGSPTIVRTRVYVADGCKVYGFAALGGTSLWQPPRLCSPQLGSTAPYHAGRLYANHVKPFWMASIDARNGALIEEFKNIVKPPAFRNGVAYFVTYSAGLIAWSTKTNSVLWQQFVGTEPALPPIAVNGVVLSVSYGAVLSVLHGQTGMILQQLPLGGHITPNGELDGTIRKGIAAGEGMIIAVTDDSVVALKPSP